MYQRGTIWIWIWICAGCRKSNIFAGILRVPSDKVWYPLLADKSSIYCQSSRKDSLISRKILPVKCCGFSHHNCSSVFGKKLSHSLRLHIAQTLPGVYTFLLRKMLHFHKYSKIFVYNTQNTIIEIWQSVKRQYEKWKSYCNICLKMRKKK